MPATRASGRPVGICKSKVTPAPSLTPAGFRAERARLMKYVKRAVPTGDAQKKAERAGLGLRPAHRPVLARAGTGARGADVTLLPGISSRRARWVPPEIIWPPTVIAVVVCATLANPKTLAHPQTCPCPRPLTLTLTLTPTPDPSASLPRV